MQKCLDRVAAGVAGVVKWDEPMAEHTSLRVGGRADLFLEPAGLDDLRGILERSADAGVPCCILGGGFNVLVGDRGIRGCVLSLRRLDLLARLDRDRIEAGAGVAIGELARYAARNALQGVEFLCGIPGSLGGALAVNAGAHGCDILSRVESIVTVSGKEMRVVPRRELDFGYRYLRLGAGEVIVSAVLQLEVGAVEEIAERMAGYLEHRSGSQKVGYPNAGSFFKNPPGAAAWRLIDEAGLRGAAVGGAQVSEVHTNFLVNRGGARAADFLELAALVKRRVKETSGVELQEEVRFLGEP